MKINRLNKAVVKKYVDAIEKAREAFHAEIEMLAAQAREAILPYFAEHRLDYRAGNGSWIISKPSADSAPYYRPDDHLDDDELPEDIRTLLCLEAEHNQCLGFFIADIKRDEYGDDSPHKLSSAQLAALYTFFVSNGRTWKSKLNDAWSTGRYRDYSGTDDVSALQQVRNTFGPTWLTKFSFNDTKTHYAKR